MQAVVMQPAHPQPGKWLGSLGACACWRPGVYASFCSRYAPVAASQRGHVPASHPEQTLPLPRP
jgi:hypothetical protein